MKKNHSFRMLFSETLLPPAFIAILVFLFFFKIAPFAASDLSVADSETIQLGLSFVFAFSLIFLYLVSIFIAGRNRSRINSVINTVDSLNRGDSNIKFQENLKGEIKVLAEKIWIYFKNIQNHLHGVRREADSNNQAAGVLSESAAEAAGKAERQAELAGHLVSIAAELAKTIDEMSELSTAQSEDLNKLANLIRSFSETSVFIGSSIGKIVGQSQNLSDRSSHGRVILSDVSDEILATVNDTQDIGSVLNVINDISDRINLLSLNAAIEAARAGDSGRGFAVVADEISRLAEQTAVSVSGIGKMIDEKNRSLARSSAEIKSAINTVEEVMVGVQELSEGLKKIERSVADQGQMNEYVVNEANKISNKSDDIENTALEQKLKIYDTINYLNQLSEYSKAINDDSIRINRMAQEIRSGTEKLKEGVDRAG